MTPEQIHPFADSIECGLGGTGLAAGRAALVASQRTAAGDAMPAP